MALILFSAGPGAAATAKPATLSANSENASAAAAQYVGPDRSEQLVPGRGQRPDSEDSGGLRVANQETVGETQVLPFTGLGLVAPLSVALALLGGGWVLRRRAGSTQLQREAGKPS